MTFDTQAGTRGARPPSFSGPIGRRVQQLMMRQHRRSWKFQGTLDTERATGLPAGELVGSAPGAGG